MNTVRTNYLKDELYGLIKTDDTIFNFIQDSAFDGMCYWDIENPGMEWMSPKFWATIGYTEDEVLQNPIPWNKLIYPDDLIFAREIFNNYSNKPDHNYNIEVRYAHKNNSTVWVKIRAIVIRYEEGKPTRMLGVQTDITKQKEYELELQNRIKRYDHIIEGTNLGTWEWNIQTGQTIFNDRFADILGYSLDDFANVNMDSRASFAHNDDIEKSAEVLKMHLKGSVPFYECEVRFKHKNGNWIWVLDKGKIVTYTLDGKAEWMTGSWQDITERKNNESLILHYQDLLERSSKAAHIGTWEVDLTKNDVYWSPETLLIHEVEANYKPNLKEAINFYPEGENRDKIVHAFNAAINSGINYDIELQIVTPANKHKWVRTIGIPVFDNNKCIKLYGLFQDIDERKLAILNLTYQEERFRQTFEHAAIGMAIVNLDGKWLQVNKSLCNILGYTEDELLALTFQDITHEDDLQLDLDNVNDLLNGVSDNYQMEKRYYHKDGSIVWVSLAVSIVKNDKNQPIHFVSQIKNITQSKALMATVQDQNFRLLNFAHIVSHNLRSHSSNFSLMLSIMKEDYPESANNEYFPLLEHASDNLKETVSHLNDIVAVQTNTHDTVVALNLLDYVNKAIESTRALALEANATIISLVPANINVLAIPAYLDSIVLNFITNAVKYKHPERPNIIELSAEINSGMAVLSIKDNGIGIDMDKYGSKLFGMYKTFHTNKDARGIGLFITKNQIDAIGGKVEVESKVNIGTTFKIYFNLGKS